MHQFQYGLNGRLVRQTDPAAGATVRQSGFAYDKAGNLTAQIDSIGMEKIKANAFSQSAAISGNYNTTTYAYDALNRQIKMTRPNPSP